MKYYSQIGQDQYFIENISQHKRGGKFLDIGANDGITESNTYVLETQFDWSGICVEANANLCKLCASNRPKSTVLCEVVWSNISTIEFTEPRNGNNLLSRINNLEWNDRYFANEFIDPVITHRKTTTIKNILEQNNIYYFDYFSLDIEGAELDALKGIDWTNTFFGFVTVEFGNREDYKRAIINFMRDKGYSLHRINRWDVEFKPITVNT